jgi:hypothetical protein
MFNLDDAEDVNQLLEKSVTRPLTVFFRKIPEDASGI